MIRSLAVGRERERQREREREGGREEGNKELCRVGKGRVSAGLAAFPWCVTCDASTVPEL